MNSMLKYLIMPDVMVFFRACGQPKAITKSPGWSFDDIPSFAAGSGIFDCIFTTAMSETKSAFTTVPSNSRPSCKVTPTYLFYWKDSK